MKVFQFAFAAFVLPQVILGDLAADLKANGLTTLLDFVVKAGLAETLRSVEPATIFAPTNDAFAALPANVVSALTLDTELLKNTLLYHVIPGNAILSSSLKADNKVDTATGASLRVNVYKGYYPLVTVNGVKVIKPDVKAGSGSIVHVIDGVLPTVAEGDNVAAVLTNDGRFKTLLAAVGAAGLAEAISTTDGLTVFAPTDDAFAKVPKKTLDFLLQPENKADLVDLLTRHVAPEVIFSKAIGCGKTLKTLNAKSYLTARRRKGSVIVKTSETTKYANVVDADIVCTNGVVHAINSVI